MPLSGRRVSQAKLIPRRRLGCRCCVNRHIRRRCIAALDHLDCVIAGRERLTVASGERHLHRNCALQLEGPHGVGVCPTRDVGPADGDRSKQKWGTVGST